MLEFFIAMIFPQKYPGFYFFRDCRCYHFDSCLLNLTTVTLICHCGEPLALSEAKGKRSNLKVFTRTPEREEMSENFFHFKTIPFKHKTFNIQAL